MSSAVKRKTKPAVTTRKRDPFLYGERYVLSILPDGTKDYIPTPMPREALLHPRDEDYPFESYAHNNDRIYLQEVLRVRAPRQVIVLSSCRVDWGVPGLEAHGPDIIVFGNVRCLRNWKTFSVAQEKAQALLAIEIVSPSTRRYDRKTKVAEYYQAGVPLYAIVDAREKNDVRTLQIIGYRRGPDCYEKMPLDEQGRLRLEPLGVLLGAEGERVCCWDARTGEKIGNYQAMVKALEAAKQQARLVQRKVVAAQRKAKVARQKEEERARQREKLRRLRGQA